MARIAIVGAAGQLGTELRSQLADTPDEVISLDRRSLDIGASDDNADAAVATTLAELFVCLLAEMTLEERKRWAGDMGSHGKTVGTRQPVQRERASSGSNATS